MIKKYLLFLLVLIINSAYSQTNSFYPNQEIFTNGANDSKFFVIDGNTYLAVAEFQDNNSVEINSTIYIWNEDSLKFVSFQEIATLGASDWEYFEIENESYLAIANYRSDTSFVENSVIYKWNGNQFVNFQEIETVGAYDWEFFEIEDTAYLTVANQDDGDTHNLNSNIYKWTGINFQEIQSIATKGATDWEAFEIDGEQYLAIANVFNLNSKIYRWNGDEFIEFQTLNYFAVTGIESFVIDNEKYLALSVGYGNGFNSTSRILKWNGMEFEHFQDINSYGSFDFEYFYMNNKHYLALANYQEATGVYTLNSELLKWNGNEFENFQFITTNAAVDFEYLEINAENYIFISEYKDSTEHNINSRLFKYEEPDTIFETIEDKNLQNIFIYPNPTNDKVEIIGIDINSSIEIYNSLGQKVFETNKQKFSIKNLEKGIYSVIIKDYDTLNNKHIRIIKN